MPMAMGRAEGRRPGLPVARARRSVSDPPRPLVDPAAASAGWRGRSPHAPGAPAMDGAYRSDPRYAEWYYAQRTRPARLPPPLARIDTCDRVYAARHLCRAGSGQPLSTAPRAVGGLGGGGAAAAARRVPPLTPQRVAVGVGAAAPGAASPPQRQTHSGGGAPRPAAASPLSGGDGSLGPTRSPATTTNRSQGAEAPPRKGAAPVSSSSDAAPNPNWSKTGYLCDDLRKTYPYSVKLTGIARTTGVPVQGFTREQSAEFQKRLLWAFATHTGLTTADVQGIRLYWDKTNGRQRDDASIIVASEAAAHTACKVQAFSYDGAELRIDEESRRAP